MKFCSVLITLPLTSLHIQHRQIKKVQVRFRGLNEISVLSCSLTYRLSVPYIMRLFFGNVMNFYFSFM
jgi:hypothetical protein